MCETERFFFFLGVKILATLTPRLFSWTRHSPRTRKMPTYGTHTPDVKYVPSSLMAFGYKGVKPVPGVPNMYLKDYQDNLWELDVRSIRPAAPETRSSHPR